MSTIVTATSMAPVTPTTSASAKSGLLDWTASGTMNSLET